MDREVLVPFFKAVVFADVMQVVASDDDGSLHLHFGHHTFTQIEKPSAQWMQQRTICWKCWLHFCHVATSVLPLGSVVKTAWVRKTIVRKSIMCATVTTAFKLQTQPLFIFILLFNQCLNDNKGCNNSKHNWTKCLPERIRPRMETFPVKGHFLSM